MSLVEEVEKEVALLASARVEAEEFIRLRAFLDEMTRLGLTKKQEYDLPLIDTVGRSLYKGAVVATSRR